MTGTRFSLEVQPVIPEKLSGLNEIANDLLYSWDREVRRLFIRLDPNLWQESGHSPKVFLRRVAQQRLDDAAEDRNFVEDYHRAMSAYNTYMAEEIDYGLDKFLNPEEDLVAYFCAEFGLHESVPIYSGGLGILAGDHCKAASDLGIPFIAIGMLYRQGYFHQTIDVNGKQVAHYIQSDFDDLPISPALDSNGKELHIDVELPGRKVTIKIWQAKAGHITIYLLDTDLEVNSEQDRRITYQLYGGDSQMRIQQDIVLGIGGVRAIRALDMAPTVWHINEGHSAFQILERCRERVLEGFDFDSALELTAGNTVFTTHTPVAAGHDIFERELIEPYFSSFIPKLGIENDTFFTIGAGPNSPGGFNMTTLALRGSRFHNGVSQIHGDVAANMESYVWPEIPPDENPLRYVTNGVHAQTFLARGWSNLFDMQFGREWRNEMLNAAYWERIEDIPDHSFWSQHQSLKSDLLEVVRNSAILQYRRNGCSEAQIERLTQHLSPHDTDVLILGFARRFATYKRANLIFYDLERLRKLLNDPDKPVLLIFAGKAHPNDIPGQQLIQMIHEYSRRPEFEGKVILLEGYDIALARKLVTGVDVWLNTPTYPLEASGTSGEKAGINGVLNLSVLDGWWNEGFNGDNGWAITPHGPQFDEHYRNQEEAKDLLNILEKQVIPLYYDRNGYGFSESWVEMSKASMKSLIPHFNSQRMVRDYIESFYYPATTQRKKLTKDNGEPARKLSTWKKQIARTWPNVVIRKISGPVKQIKSGSALPVKVAVNLQDLSADDVIVECLVGKENQTGNFILHRHYIFEAKEKNDQNETIFELDLKTDLPGLQLFKIRMYPSHDLLSHRFETGLMKWL